MDTSIPLCKIKHKSIYNEAKVRINVTFCLPTRLFGTWTFLACFRTGCKTNKWTLPSLFVMSIISMEPLSFVKALRSISNIIPPVKYHISSISLNGDSISLNVSINSK
ncbi:hypothetical protein AAZX31_12G119600 [Glycine max]